MTDSYVSSRNGDLSPSPQWQLERLISLVAPRQPCWPSVHHSQEAHGLCRIREPSQSSSPEEREEGLPVHCYGRRCVSSRVLMPCYRAQLCGTTQANLALASRRLSTRCSTLRCTLPRCLCLRMLRGHRLWLSRALALVRLVRPVCPSRPSAHGLCFNRHRGKWRQASSDRC